MATKILKGTVYLMAAEVVFLITAYTMNIVLARFLGPATYGVIGVVFSLMSLYQIMLITGTPKAISKFIAELPKEQTSIKNAGLKFQLILGTLLFVIIASFSEQIALLFNDESLAPYIFMSAFFIPTYGLYVIYTGVLNGNRRFVEQAVQKAIYAVSKSALVLIFAFTPLKVAGAIIGFTISPLISYLYIRTRLVFGKAVATFKVSKVARFALPLIAFAAIFNFITTIDLFFVKSLLTNDTLAGYYASALNISKMPFFVFIGLASTLFPSIAAAYAAKKVPLIQRYIQQSFRYLLILTLPFAFLVSAASSQVLGFLFGSEFIPAAPALSILVFGYVMISVSMVFLNIIQAINRIYQAVIISLGLLLFDIAMNIVLIPRFGLVGASLATMLTGLVGIIVTSVFVYFKFKVLIKMTEVIRIVASCIVIYLLAKVFPFTGFWLIPQFVGLFVVYLLILLAIGELKKKDILRYRDFLRK